jgi:hypothetical protein
MEREREGQRRVGESAAWGRWRGIALPIDYGEGEGVATLNREGASHEHGGGSVGRADGEREREGGTDYE